MIRRSFGLALVLTILLVLVPQPKLNALEGGTTLVINSGIRDLNPLGSAWYDEFSNQIGDIRLTNDFITVYQKSASIAVVSRYGDTLYAVDLGKWTLNDESLEDYFKIGVVEGLYFDWLLGRWRVWQRGVDNETHGMPDFTHPAFRQTFKWMLNIKSDYGDLNITFYMTNHDPYIRLMIDSNVDGVLVTNVRPMPLIRMGLEANISDYSKHLLNWNQANSKLHGNPWTPPAWSDTSQGVIGQIFIMQPSSGVEIKKITNYNQDLNRFVNTHAYNNFNWIENRTENWYSFEFYIRNEKSDSQDIILENYVPDDVYKVDIYYYNGDNYISVGSWSGDNFGTTIYFTDPLGIKHYFTVNEPIKFGEKTGSGIPTSQYYGMKKRVLMELNLSGGYVNNPNIFGGSQLRLKFKFYYRDPGYATYLFSTDYNSKYGLANMLSPYILLFNYTTHDKPLFISAKFTEANLFIKSNDKEIITDVGFKIDLSKVNNYLFAIGYNGEMDTWRDDDSDNIPDIFEARAFQWSNEKLSDASKTSLTYYDIVIWNSTDVGNDLVENHVKLEWHGMGIKLFGIGTPYAYGWDKCKCIITSVRNIDGYQHLMVQADGYINFKISYDVEAIYSEAFDFDYDTSTMEISISYRTRHGYPYYAYVITEVRDLARRIYRTDEIPEGKRNMPDLEYWNLNTYRNNTVDTDSWYIDLEKDILIRYDQFSSVNYLIKVTINPKVEISIDYSHLMWRNNLSISFDYGYYWDRYFDLLSAVDRAKAARFRMARIHLRVLYRGVRYPPSPCIEWDPVNHRSLGYDWSKLDHWIEGVVYNWGMIPLMSIGDHKVTAIPRGMPYIDLGGGDILPNPTDFAEFFADVTKHIVVDLNVSPIYLEVINEPHIPDDSAALLFIELYNMVRRRVAQVLEPYNKSLGRDVFLGINYIDRFPNLRKPFFEYILEGVDDMEFASVHMYPGAWAHCFTHPEDNPRFIYYPPNNKRGWLTDDVIIDRVYNLTYMYGLDRRVSYDEMRIRWMEKFGHDLILMVTEANLAGTWKNGSDPREQNLFSAVVNAIMLKNYAFDGFSQYFFFQLASMHGPESPMYKYGGFGLAIMNYTPPHEPFAPYLVAYLWGNYMIGGQTLNYSISEPDLVDILPIKVGSSYRIWIINKVDSSVTIYINPPSSNRFRYYQVVAHVIDSSSYQQRYDPELDRVVFGRREIRDVRLLYMNPIKLELRGYSVAVLEFREIIPPHPWPIPVGAPRLLWFILLAIILPVNKVRHQRLSLHT